MTVSAVPFYAAGLFDVPVGFKRISGPGADAGYEIERAVGGDEHGDETGDAGHSRKWDFTEEFEAVKGGSFALPPTLGIVVGGATLLGFDLDTGLYMAKLTLHGTKYSASDVTPTRKYDISTLATAWNALLGTGFGAKDFMAGTSDVTKVCKVLSGKLSISCSVQAAYDEVGVYVQHEVHSGKLNANTSWLNKPSADAEAGWITSGKPDRKATDFYKWDVTGNKLGPVSSAVV